MAAFTSNTPVTDRPAANYDDSVGDAYTVTKSYLQLTTNGGAGVTLQPVVPTASSATSSMGNTPVTDHTCS